MIAVSDTGPINYLILLGVQDVLGTMFQEVALPFEVATELGDAKAPKEVRDWLLVPPAWLRVSEPGPNSRPLSLQSGGELQPADISCIELAQSIAGCTLLMDDRAARQEAVARGVFTLGTLALLFRAGELGLLDFGDALTRLEHTTFRASGTLRTHYRERWQKLQRANG